MCAGRAGVLEPRGVQVWAGVAPWCVPHCFPPELPLDLPLFAQLS